MIHERLERFGSASASPAEGDSAAGGASIGCVWRAGGRDRRWSRWTALPEKVAPAAELSRAAAVLRARRIMTLDQRRARA